ncbi:g11546 [Coccomyxa elongata]
MLASQSVHSSGIQTKDVCKDHFRVLPQNHLPSRRVPFQGTNTHCSAGDVSREPSRRQLLSNGVAVCGGLMLAARQLPASAVDAGAATQVNKLLCDEECLAKLDSIETQETKSGLKYKDIVVGKGPSPPTGYQVTAHYVAMTPSGKVFDSSLDRGFPYDIRVGAGQIVAGLDEGVATMKVGGLRRLYIPGNLSFPKGLPSGPGRPRVPPASPVVFDVQLLYIPGLDSEEE